MQTILQRVNPVKEQRLHEVLFQVYLDELTVAMGIEKGDLTT